MERELSVSWIKVYQNSKQRISNECVVYKKNTM